MSFTDRRPNASWRTTYLRSLPWSERPELASLDGFHVAMIMGDMLHIFNLGVARHAAACVLKTILQERLIFDGATIEARLQQATDSLK